MSSKPIPDGYHAVTPYLIITGAAKALEFYKEAFGAKELLRLSDPSGGIAHAEIAIDGSPIMLAEEFPDMGYRSPKSIGGTATSIHLYVSNADEVFNQAVRAGAKVRQPLKDQFYGDRSGTVEDPFGHVWTIATHKEDLSQAEIDKRFAEILHQQGSNSK